LARKKKRTNHSIKSSLVLGLIRDSGPLTPAQLSNKAGLGLVTAGKYVDQMIQQGYIAETGFEKSTGGRRARLLDVNPQFGPALGIEIGGSRLICTIASYGGVSLETVHCLPPAGVPVFDVLVEQIDSLMARVHTIKAIGIASSGIVQSETGISFFSPHRSDMENLPLKTLLEDRYGVPVWLDDISRCAAFAETRLGVLKGEGDYLYLYLDEGIWMCCSTRNTMFRGTLGIEGEVGHFVIDRNGPRCGCGNRGCLEVFASSPAIVSQVERALEKGVRSIVQHRAVNIETIIQAGLAGDKLCYQAINEAAERVGLVMAQVLNLTGIPNLVIGGCLANAGLLLQEPINRMVKTHSLSVLSRDWSVRVSPLDERSGALGAAILALRSIVGKENSRIKELESIITLR